MSLKSILAVTASRPSLSFAGLASLVLLTNASGCSGCSGRAQEPEREPTIQAFSPFAI